jgi:CBS domain-containing protein
MQAFLSYTHFDDEHNENFITRFRDALIKEVQSQTGEKIGVFQDRTDISWGQNWRRRIEHALNEANFLIPVITPSFFKSAACLDELKKFLEHEEHLQRNDLILPLYFIDAPAFDDDDNELVAALHSHQYVDWRKLRFTSFRTASVRKALAELATQMRRAMDRTKYAVEQAKEEFGRSIVEFGDRPVSEILCSSSEIMQPRPDIVAVEASLSIIEARKVIVETKYTCIPIYRDVIDNIEGLLYAPDLLAYCEPNKENLPVVTCAREVYFIPETKPIAQVLDDMLSPAFERMPRMAIVIDEYGGVSGLVTMNDILRELFAKNLSESTEVG